MRLVLDGLNNRRRCSTGPLQLDNIGRGRLCRSPNDNKETRLLSLVTIGDKPVGVDPSWNETSTFRVSG